MIFYHWCLICKLFVLLFYSKVYLFKSFDSRFLFLKIGVLSFTFDIENWLSFNFVFSFSFYHLMKVDFIFNETRMLVNHLRTLLRYFLKTIQIELPYEWGNFCMVKILGQHSLKHLIMTVNKNCIAFGTPTYDISNSGILNNK